VKDVICMKARALGKPLGLFSSAQNEKVTWPAVEILVSNCHSVQIAGEKEERFTICKNNVHDRPRPLTNSTAEWTASTSPASSLEIPIATMAVVITVMTESQAIHVSAACKYNIYTLASTHIIDKCGIIFIVRGKPNIKHTTNPKNPIQTKQRLWPVRTFIAIENDRT